MHTKSATKTFIIKLTTKGQDGLVALKWSDVFN